MIRKIMSLLLSAALAFSAFSLSAYAAEETGKIAFSVSGGGCSVEPYGVSLAEAIHWTQREDENGGYDGICSLKLEHNAPWNQNTVLDGMNASFRLSAKPGYAIAFVIIDGEALDFSKSSALTGKVSDKNGSVVSVVVTWYAKDGAKLDISVAKTNVGVDTVCVNDETGLENALSEESISSISVVGSFHITKNLTLEKPVTVADGTVEIDKNVTIAVNASFGTEQKTDDETPSLVNGGILDVGGDGSLSLIDENTETGVINIGENCFITGGLNNKGAVNIKKDGKFFADSDYGIDNSGIFNIENGGYTVLQTADFLNDDGGLLKLDGYVILNDRYIFNSEKGTITGSGSIIVNSKPNEETEKALETIPENIKTDRSHYAEVHTFDELKKATEDDNCLTIYASENISLAEDTVLNEKTLIVEDGKSLTVSGNTVLELFGFSVVAGENTEKTGKKASSSLSIYGKLAVNQHSRLDCNFGRVDISESGVLDNSSGRVSVTCPVYSDGTIKSLKTDNISIYGDGVVICGGNAYVGEYADSIFTALKNNGVKNIIIRADGSYGDRTVTSANPGSDFSGASFSGSPKDIDFDRDITVESGGTFVISGGENGNCSHVVIEKGAVMTCNGALEVDGELENNGKLIINGSIGGTGKISGNGSFILSSNISLTVDEAGDTASIKGSADEESTRLIAGKEYTTDGDGHLQQTANITAAFNEVKLSNNISTLPDKLKAVASSLVSSNCAKTKSYGLVSAVKSVLTLDENKTYIVKLVITVESISANYTVKYSVKPVISDDGGITWTAVPYLASKSVNTSDVEFRLPVCNPDGASFVSAVMQDGSGTFLGMKNYYTSCDSANNYYAELRANVFGTVTLCMDWIYSDDIIAGDVNSDKKVTAADARLALRSAAKLTVLLPEQIFSADMDCSDAVTSSDARKILRIAAGL